MRNVFVSVLVASTLISLVTGPVSAELPKSKIKVEQTEEEDRNFKLRFRDYSESLGRVSLGEAAWPGLKRTWSRV